MSNLSLPGTWSFHPLVEAFPSTVLPNIAYWNVTNGTWEYQVQVSWTFQRDALYGHSFTGLFVLYALFARPHMFDVYVSASPCLVWNHEYFFSADSPLFNRVESNKTTKPALLISYGKLEQHARKRRTETLEAFEARRAFRAGLKMEELCTRLFREVEGGGFVRDVQISEYPFSYHAAVGGNAVADGIDYFLDW